jgi:predicted phage replisome organizer
MGNETNNKRYYWLKLEKNFFKDARIKKLRRLAGGDTYTIIYLKLMLLSIELEGKLVYEGIYPTFEEEMADKIDEYDKHLEDVKIAISWLQSEQILLPLEDGDYKFHNLPIGSETKNNIYKKQKRLEKFQSDSNQLPIDIDIEKDIDKDIELEKDNISKKKFSKPSLQDVQDYINEKNYHFSAEDFVNHYEAVGWKVGKSPMKDWRACCRTWESNYNKKNPKAQPSVDMMEYMKDWLDK